MVTLFIIVAAITYIYWQLAKTEIAVPEYAEIPIPPGVNWDFHSDGQTVIHVNPRKGENLPRA
jgi:hypothetical protein